MKTIERGAFYDVKGEVCISTYDTSVFIMIKSDFIFKGGYTPLHFAAKAGQKDAVLFLLEKGANVNAVADVCL